MGDVLAFQDPNNFDEELYDAINDYEDPDTFMELLRTNPEITQNQPISSEFVKQLVFEVVRKEIQEMEEALIKFFEPEAENDPQKQLIIALLKGNIEETELLLKNGVSLNYGEWKGEYLPAIYSIVFFCTFNSSKDMFTLLIKYGLDTSIRSEKNQNLLHAISDNHPFGNKENMFEIAKILYNSGIPIDEVDDTGLSPLQCACKKSHDYEYVKFLIDNGAKVNRKDNDGDNLPLISSVSSDFFLDVTKLLLSSGADINAIETYSGETALHKACLFTYKSQISLLLAHGADVTIEDKGGFTPFLLLNDFGRNDNGYNQCVTVMIKEFAQIYVGTKDKNKFFSKDSDKALMDKIIFSISPKNMRSILSSDVKTELFERCVLEIIEMRKIKFYPPYSYLQVLNISKIIQKMARLTKNKEFRTKFEANLNLFPYYKEDLTRNFKRAVQAGNDWVTVLSRLNDVFKKVLPDVVIRIMAENLTANDLPL